MNDNLQKAKKAKADEFYTMYEDIESEMNAYYEYNHNVFKDKVILCPCDDYEWSNFTKYFMDNFEKYKIKKLICSCYIKDGHGKVLEYDGKNTHKYTLNGDGDFRSDEVTKLRDEADIIITNPPFSLLREFVAWIMDGNKSFSIIGNQNAITYKEVFPLIKDNKMWIGAQSGCISLFFRMPKEYKVSDEAKKVCVSKFGEEFCEENNMTYMRTACWFTNIDCKKHTPPHLGQQRKCPDKYEKYDGFDIYEISRSEYLDDFIEKYSAELNSGKTFYIGVPITFLYRHEEYPMVEIYGANKHGFPTYFSVNGRKLYFRIVLKIKPLKDFIY